MKNIFRAPNYGMVRGLKTMCTGALFFILVYPATLANAQHVIKVWAVISGNHKLYHCPKSKWYGVGAGKEMDECQAIREGYAPAVGNSCGTNCN